MHVSTTEQLSPQQDFIPLSRANGLTSRGSRSTATSLIAKLSASGLVIASAGFGCVYAWQAGSHHGMTIGNVPVLASLAVLMAISLECAKPFAIAQCLIAFRQWNIAQGVLLALLGLIAVAYSLSAELSLMAMVRADTAAERQTLIDAGIGEASAVKHKSERYDAAKAELANLSPSRPVAEVQAAIDGLLLMPGVNGCAAIDGSVTRKVCPKVVAARTELARAQRRAELEASMAVAFNRAANGSKVEVVAVNVADPGSSALSTYLAIFGVVVAPERLADWLVLLSVLALEVGSALAGVLAGSAETHSIVPKLTTLLTAKTLPVIKVIDQPVTLDAGTAWLTTPVTASVIPVVTCKDGRDEELKASAVTGTATASMAVVRDAATDPGQHRLAAKSVTVPMTAVRAAGRHEAARRLLSLLRDSGGSIDASRQALGRMIAATPSTAYAALNVLAAQGQIEAITSCRGTAIRIAA